MGRLSKLKPHDWAENWDAYIAIVFMYGMIAWSVLAK